MRFFILLLCLVGTVLSNPCQGQSGSWEQLEDVPFSAFARPFHFELDGSIYVGGGQTIDGELTRRMWAYDEANGTWTQKGSLPGDRRSNAVGFSLNGFAYVGTGFNGTNHLSDFWKYNPTTNAWTQIDDFPGGPRSHTLVITSGTTAYLVGGGRAADDTFFRDMWSFDSTTETWQQLESYPGPPSWRLFGWIIDDKLYVGGGEEFPDGAFNGFHSYDLNSGSWSETNLPSCPTLRTSGGYSFTLQGKGYFSEGYNGQSTSVFDFGRKLFSFDPDEGQWSVEPDFPGPPRFLGFSTVVNGKAYVGAGDNFITDNFYQDFYVFTPTPTSRRSVTNENIAVKAFPNPVTQDVLTVSGDFSAGNPVTVRLYDLKGATIQLPIGALRNASGGDIQLDVTDLAPGMYQIELLQNEKRGIIRFVRQ